MKPIRILLLSILMSFLMASASGQDLKINSIFEKYGKAKGSTMVLLSGEAVQNFQLKIYKSITLKYDSSLLEEIQMCLEDDKKHARKIQEVISNGVIRSGYYQLPDVGKKLNRYILFKIGDNHEATLIYMEGDLQSEELINKLFTKE